MQSVSSRNEKKINEELLKCSFLFALSKQFHDHETKSEDNGGRPLSTACTLPKVAWQKFDIIDQGSNSTLWY